MNMSCNIFSKPFWLVMVGSLSISVITELPFASDLAWRRKFRKTAKQSRFRLEITMRDGKHPCHATSGYWDPRCSTSTRKCSTSACPWKSYEKFSGKSAWCKFKQAHWAQTETRHAKPPCHQSQDSKKPRRAMEVLSLNTKDRKIWDCHKETEDTH